MHNLSNGRRREIREALLRVNDPENISWTLHGKKIIIKNHPFSFFQTECQDHHDHYCDQCVEQDRRVHFDASRIAEELIRSIVPSPRQQYPSLQEYAWDNCGSPH